MRRRQLHPDDVVIRDEVIQAVAERRRVDQKRLAALLPGLTPSALNSRVVRMRAHVKRIQERYEARRAPHPQVEAQEPAASLPVQVPSATVQDLIQVTTQDETRSPQPTRMDAAAETTDRVPGQGATIAAGSAHCVEELEVAQDLIDLCQASADDEMDQEMATCYELRPDAAADDEEHPSQQDVESQRLTSELATERAKTAQLELELATERTKTAQLEIEKLATEEEASHKEMELITRLAQAQVDLEGKSRAGDVEVERLTAELTKERARSKQLAVDVLSAKSNTSQKERELAFQAKALQKAQDDVKSLTKVLQDEKASFSGRLRSAQDNFRMKMQGNVDDKQREVDELQDRLDKMQREHAAEVHGLMETIKKLKDEMEFTRWVEEMHHTLTRVEEDLQVITDLFAPLLRCDDRATLYSKHGKGDINVYSAMRFVAKARATYYAEDYHTQKAFEDDLEKWRMDRNHFCHRHDTSELQRRGNVVANARAVHQALQVFLDDLGRLSDSDLQQLAIDAYPKSV